LKYQNISKIGWNCINKEIAAEFSISVKNIEAHKAGAMRKLGIESRIKIVRFTILQGWLENNRIPV